MEWEPIRKNIETLRVRPNLTDYARARAEFSWDAVRRALGHASGELNIAREAVERNAQGPLRDHLALRWLGKSGERRDFTCAELHEESNRYANVLRRLGVGKGDRVAVLAGRIPEMYLTALGAWKNGSVFCPLFSAFGPEPVFQRLNRGNAQVLVTTEKQYRQKVAAQREQLPQLRHVLLTDIEDDASADVLSLHKLVTHADDCLTATPTSADDMANLHFTSGTTGMPKGAIHVHGAVVVHYMTAQTVLDLHPGDIYWCTADPGWVTGTSYGIIAPLLHGVTNIVDEADFDAERWYRILQQEHVTVWYTAPTAIRRLMRIGGEPREQHNLSALRLVHSVGEPLNPEAVLWGQAKLGLPIHDNWWQTETGGIMIANYAAMDIRPGSMGKPVPGIEAAIVRKVGKDQVEVIEKPHVDGELALKPGWPSMFRGYLHDEERYRKCFVGGWYITGDLAARDADGYYWFVGRADDIIKTAGHMVGPFEVESTLMEHPAVAEAGVIGKPEPTIGELVKAFVTLKPGFTPSDALRMELLGFGRTKLGSAVAPKELEFQATLPHTRSGKIMRRLLRTRELGLPEGDLSTLEEDA